MVVLQISAAEGTESRGDSLQRLENSEQGQDEEDERRPVDELRRGLVDDCEASGPWVARSQTRHHSQIAKRAHVMAAAPAASPSLLANAYAAAVDSRNTKARKTKILVQTPALWVCALTPNASNRDRITRTMVPVHQQGPYRNDQNAYTRGRGRREGGQRPPRRRSPLCHVTS